MPSVWNRMQEDMQLAGLATRTQESYLSAARRLADHVQKDPTHITEDDLRQYFLYLRNERKLSRSTLTIALCSIKFLFERHLRLWIAGHGRRLTQCPADRQRPHAAPYPGWQRQ